MTLVEKISSTCVLHNIKKLEVYYFSLACNIKSKCARHDDATKFKSIMETLVVQEPHGHENNMKISKLP